MLTLLWPSKLKLEKISSSNFLVVEFILSLSVFLYLICSSLVERFICDLHLIRIGFNIVSDGDMWTVVLINPCVWNVGPSGRYSNGEAYSQDPTHPIRSTISSILISRDHREHFQLFSKSIFQTAWCLMLVFQMLCIFQIVHLKNTRIHLEELIIVLLSSTFHQWRISIYMFRLSNF